jgi:hypothetical protein
MIIYGPDIRLAVIIALFKNIFLDFYNLRYKKETHLNNCKSSSLYTLNILPFGISTFGDWEQSRQ